MSHDRIEQPLSDSGRRIRGPVAGASAFALALGLLTPGAPAAAEPVAHAVTFDRVQYIASLSEVFTPDPAVTVTDENGDPVAGVDVEFTVSADPVSGSTAALDTATVQTDGAGRAEVTTTSSSIGGFSTMTAAVGAIEATTLLVSRPSGYQPGEQLASVVGEDQDGVRRDIRDTVRGATYTLIDVCAGWCGPCRLLAEDVEKARQRLYDDYRIRLEFTSLLVDGDPGIPSTAQDARVWKQRNGLSGAVLHAEGSRQSDVYRAAQYFLFDDDDDFGAFPTHLLVNPKGKIVDRIVGLMFDEGVDQVDALVARVLAATGRTNRPTLPSVPEPTAPTRSQVIAQVGVTIGEQSVEERFSMTDEGRLTDLGYVFFLGDDSGSAVTTFDYGIQTAGAAFPSSGELSISLTRYGKDAKQSLVSTSLPVTLFSYLVETDSFVAVQTTLTATSTSRGTVAVTADLADLRGTLRQKLEAGDFAVLTGGLGAPTAEQIDALVESMVAVLVRATYTK